MTIEERADYFRDHYGTYRSALIATLTEFEAFRRDASDEIERCILGDFAKERLSRLIIPKPVDPLVEAIREASVSDADDGDADRLRAALAKRGLKLVEVGDAD